jgi:hypothetical protein
VVKSFGNSAFVVVCKHLGLFFNPFRLKERHRRGHVGDLTSFRNSTVSRLWNSQYLLPWIAQFLITLLLQRLHRFKNNSGNWFYFTSKRAEICSLLISSTLAHIQRNVRLFLSILVLSSGSKLSWFHHLPKFDYCQFWVEISAAIFFCFDNF